jgi:hypothetical protein
MDFTIRFVVRPHRQAEFEVELKVVHVRTRDFREKLESHRSTSSPVFGRKNERDHYALTLLWNAFIARRPPA